MFSVRSETDDGLSSCSNFTERQTDTELASNKPILLEIDRTKCKRSNKVLASFRDVLNRIAVNFSKPKANIGCCILWNMREK